MPQRAPEEPTDFDFPSPTIDRPRHGEGDGTQAVLPVDPARAALEGAAEALRYAPRKLLGRGGMGEVRLCKDDWIGREVAMKTLLPTHGRGKDARERFLREARVQGQLEHPSIVPVYDLGVREGGEVYFTMKCLRGHTLRQVLKDLAAGDERALATYTRHKLLGIFAAVCLAVDFAHARGVLHRDLKPANIMIGDFGEVYVLDWGIARVRGAPEPEHSLDVAVSGPGATQDGRIVGTLGYMAPEQARGKRELVDVRSDVYALGVILFEILALEPLHPRSEDPVEMLLSMARGLAGNRPSERCPGRDVPPELDEICVRATALDPANRYPSARALHEAVERYLAGDRDVALRRSLADKHAAAAGHAAERALAGAGDMGARKDALHEAGRALALDPSNEAALAVVARVLKEPPREVPAAVRDKLDDEESRDLFGRLLFVGTAQCVASLAFLALALARGTSHLGTVLGCVGLMLFASATKFLMYWRRTLAASAWYGSFVLTAVAWIVAGRMLIPLLITPFFLGLNTIGFALQSSTRRRRVLVALGVLSIVGCFLIEPLGLVSPSYVVRGDTVELIMPATGLGFQDSLIVMAASLILGTGGTSLLVGRSRLAQRKAQEQARVLTWQLEALLPDRARTLAFASEAAAAGGMDGAAARHA
ncbi:serine/threonine-protein kinase [Polyangium sp. y55x31]|uniref:serine/threonine-protein kinase n=1 Tax=Polyangium sp. y55x31 TaxID=3042688 RepID=UPI0024822601|nr:serine/threonine-protein kinase [Polyangium sp. y55x31]MDI1479306.1 serine/threonine-protein kinase [Polyangium sp. y55x31]